MPEVGELMLNQRLVPEALSPDAFAKIFATDNALSSKLADRFGIKIDDGNPALPARPEYHVRSVQLVEVNPSASRCANSAAQCAAPAASMLQCTPAMLAESLFNRFDGIGFRRWPAAPY
jgi:hypothetical protein